MRTSLFITRYNLVKYYKSGISNIHFGKRSYRISQIECSRFEVITLLHGLESTDDICIKLISRMGWANESQYYNSNEYKSTYFENKIDYKSFYNSYIRDIRYKGFDSSYDSIRGIDYNPQLKLTHDYDVLFNEYFKQSDNTKADLNIIIYLKTVVKNERCINLTKFNKMYFTNEISGRFQSDPTQQFIKESDIMSVIYTDSTRWSF